MGISFVNKTKAVNESPRKFHLLFMQNSHPFIKEFRVYSSGDTIRRMSVFHTGEIPKAGRLDRFSNPLILCIIQN
jgi:hypothetical protein